MPDITASGQSNIVTWKVISIGTTIVVAVFLILWFARTAAAERGGGLQAVGGAILEHNEPGRVMPRQVCADAYADFFVLYGRGALTHASPALHQQPFGTCAALSNLAARWRGQTVQTGT